MVEKKVAALVFAKKAGVLLRIMFAVFANKSTGISKGGSRKQ